MPAPKQFETILIDPATQTVKRHQYKRTNDPSEIAKLLGCQYITAAPLNDEGDILLCPGVIVECKAYATYSDAQVMLWLGETERERINAGRATTFDELKAALKPPAETRGTPAAGM